jgi:hypothetical protein
MVLVISFVGLSLTEIPIGTSLPDAQAFEEGIFDKLVPVQMDNDGKMYDFLGQIYTFYKRELIDHDGDGTKETTLSGFSVSSKKRLLRYVTNGKTWAWAILLNFPDRHDYVNNFIIVDSKGTGKFDRKYMRNEPLPFPPYLLRPSAPQSGLPNEILAYVPSQSR